MAVPSFGLRDIVCRANDLELSDVFEQGEASRNADSVEGILR
jgi:hypothetical protein